MHNISIKLFKTTIDEIVFELIPNEENGSIVPILQNMKLIIRINVIYAYISIMKARLNITVDERLLNNAKHYAAKNDTSLSQLIELYFESLTRPARRKNIIQLVDELPKPKIDLSKDLKQAYYEDQKGKYGF